MYTKVFRSIYDGTLADNWQAMVTFQQMLILADSQGVVDMTPSAMARITGIPLEILAAGIAVLEAPDAGSRTPEMEGRRIARLDAHRDWGWFLVNFAKYRAMQTREEKNEADRERMRSKRGGALSGGVRGKSCEYCGGEATGVDHIIPTSAGGMDVDANVVACCLRCNASKNSRPLLTFLNDPLTRADRGVVLNSSKLMGLVAIDEKSGLFVASCRQLSPVVAGCSQLPLVVADVAHTDLDLDLKQQKKELPPLAGENPPTEPPKPPEPDPIFGVGLAFLLAKGVPERNARSFLGLLRKECGSDIVASGLLTRAEQDDISDPVAWLTKAARASKSSVAQLSLVPAAPEPVKASHRPLAHTPRG